MSEVEELLTTAQVARELGYSREGVAAAARSGRLTVARKLPTEWGSKNGALLFRRSDVERWQASGQTYRRRSRR